MKQFVKNFNNSVNKIIFKVQNKTNNNFKISSFNKYLITFIVLLFVYLFYLLIPLLYEKTWVQNNIESKLFHEFKISLSTPDQISYRILPAPHFLIKDSKILMDSVEKQKSIAEVKNLKIFLNQGNFFNKKKIAFKKVIINKASFSLSRNDIILLNESRNKNFSNKQIKINNSNIFLKNNLGEVISIVKIYKAILFFDDKKLLNFFNMKGEAFNMPFVFDLEDHNGSAKYKKFNFNSKSLKLNIFNESHIEKNNSIRGENIISFLNSTINTKYNVKEKLINFKSDNSRINNSQANLNGRLSINPFDLNLNINLEDHEISKLSKINPILNELMKSELFFNDNISINTSIDINSNSKNEIFQNAKINFHIINGKINFNNTSFFNDNIGLLELRNSNLFLKNNKLILTTDVLINVKNSEGLFSLLHTSKKLRKEIKNIFINLDYNFLSNQIKFNNIKIDNKDIGNQLLKKIEVFNDNNSNNLIKSRQIINELLKKNYDG